MGYTVFAVVVIALAFLGLLFTKNGELSGLGRDHARGGLRAPHGKLVRTKRLDNVEEASFFEVFPKLALILFGVTAVIFLLSFVGVLAWDGAVGVSLDFLLVIGLAIVLLASDAGYWKPSAYSIAGYILFAAVPSLMWIFVPSVAESMGVGIVNALTMILGTLGTALLASFMPAVRTYAREFEDGHVNTIQVSSRSTACKAYVALEDASWKPPADRIKNPEAANDPRAFVGRD